jgi:superfamily II DNA helicase RecQ
MFAFLDEPEKPKTKRKENVSINAQGKKVYSKKQKSVVDDAGNLHLDELFSNSFTYTPPNDENTCLNELKALRSNLALQYQIPAAEIYDDAVLKAMSVKLPKNFPEFVTLPGAGDAQKWSRFGQNFLNITEKYVRQSSGHSTTKNTKTIKSMKGIL